MPTDSERAVREARADLSRATRVRWDAEAAFLQARKAEREAQAVLDAALGLIGVGGRGAERAMATAGAQGGAGEGERSEA